MSIISWRQIQRENFTTLEPLFDFLEISENLRSRVLLQPSFPLNLPRRLANKIKKNTLDDPILKQFIPLIEETVVTPHFLEDPVSDLSFQKTKKLLHKYKGRALLLTSSACAMNCRFCFRKNFPYVTEEKGYEKELEYLANDPTISELILSGGDPLAISNADLGGLFHSLDAIPHIKRIRFHTRFPIGIPERIDEPLLEIFAKSSKQIFFIVHVNHPFELDGDIIVALKKIQCLGIPVLNQSTLLKGVNDSESILLSLYETLLNNGIIPYYLHLLDPVQGAGHFALPKERGQELIRHVQHHLSGFGVPRLAQEEPGMPSKTFITY